MFFIKGCDKCSFKGVWKDTFREKRLTMVVIGLMRAGRQDLSSLVGMRSRLQVASEEEFMARDISSVVAGLNCRI